ncbi:uncharacterized protein VNE69_06030 [Vairimorpha necatrix]|uniref:GIT Spa2 homology (SHD) domain-containing protein n=1 Tax=Vairimorpha necatrix TaxID=6039 RepID=A0AAX4JCH9_9MICR
MDREIIKYTLKSYLGDHTNFSSPEKKKETFDKLSTLSVRDFEKFVNDIINEIHRRTDMEYKKPRKHSMRKKLIQMKEDTFKNLVFDLLEVYDVRYPSNMEDEIENISQIITCLKMKENLNQQILNETNITLKINFFLEYIIQKYNIKDEIVDHMVEYIDNNIQEELTSTFEGIFNYKLFIDKLDKTRYASLEKYIIYRDNIKRLENMNINEDIKKEMIFNEFLNIVKFVIDKQIFHDEDSITRSVNSFIETVSKIEYDEESCVKETGKIKESLDLFVESCQGILINSEHLTGLQNIKSKDFLIYEDIVESVNLIRKVLDDIKHNKM